MDKTYKRELVRHVIGLGCSWSALPWAFRELGASLSATAWALLPVLVALLGPLLVVLAPALAWLSVRDAREDEAVLAALRKGHGCSCGEEH